MTAAIRVQPPHLLFDGRGPVSIAIEVENRAEVIDRYDFKIFGVDSEWVEFDYPTLQLFPQELKVSKAQIWLPADFPGGVHELLVEARSQVFPERRFVSRINVEVAGFESLQIELSPNRAISGKKGEFGLTAINKGNQECWVEPCIDDPEAVTTALFTPERALLQPGHQALFKARLEASRPWVGQPASRVLAVKDRKIATLAPQLFNFIQKPKIGRWVISLAGLLVTALVFAFVLTSQLKMFADHVGVDRETMQDIFADPEELNLYGDAEISGDVIDASSSRGVKGANVLVFDDASDPPILIRESVSGSGGKFVVSGLNSLHRYRVKVERSGYQTTWLGGPTYGVSDAIFPTDGLPLLLEGEAAVVEGEVEGMITDGAEITLLLDPASLRLPNAKEKNHVVVANAVLDQDASYEFGDLKAGRYRLRATLPGVGVKYSDYFELEPGEILKLPNLATQAGNGRIDGVLVSYSNDGVMPLPGREIILQDDLGKQLYEVSAIRSEISVEIMTRAEGAYTYEAPVEREINIISLGGADPGKGISCRLPRGTSGCRIHRFPAVEQLGRAMLPGDEMEMKVSVSSLLGTPLLGTVISVTDSKGARFLCSEDGDVDNDLRPVDGRTFDSLANAECGFGGLAMGEAVISVTGEAFEKQIAEVFLEDKTSLDVNFQVPLVEVAQLQINGPENQRKYQQYVLLDSSNSDGLKIELPVQSQLPDQYRIVLNQEYIVNAESHLDFEVLVRSGEGLSVLCEVPSGSLGCTFSSDIVPTGTVNLVVRDGTGNVAGHSQVFLGTSEVVEINIAAETETPSFLTFGLRDPAGDLWVPSNDEDVIELVVVGASSDGFAQIEVCGIGPNAVSCAFERDLFGFGEVSVFSRSSRRWMTEPFTLSAALGQRQITYLNLVPTLEVPNLGAFSFKDLPTPGNYRLTVKGDSQFETISSMFRLDEGETLGEQTLVANPKTGRVSGILESNGVGAGGVLMEISDGQTSWSTTSFTVASDSGDYGEGGFIFGGLPVPGRYELAIVDDRYAPALTDVTLSVDSPSVSVPHPITLSKSYGSLTGGLEKCLNLRCDATTPLTGAKLYLRSDSANFETVSVSSCVLVSSSTSASNCEGTFRFDNIPHGVFDLVITGDGLSDQIRRVIIGPGLTPPERIVFPYSD